LKKVVSNATPIISLAIVDRLELLRDIFSKIHIPQAVYDEIVSAKYPGYKTLNSNLFETKKVQNSEELEFFLNDLDLGEAECIQLAKEINSDILIIDERSGYKIAQSEGLFVIGTLTVLLMAKKKGIILEVRPLLDKMMQSGRWYSSHVYKYFLESIGEL
jgi:predicted nucleic acid-binding protein